MRRLALTLLGGFEARLDDGPALTFPTRKVEGLLAYLALPPGHAHPRDKLTALLWGDVPEAQARASLRQSLFTLRRALAAADPPALAFEGQAVALHPAAVEVDVASFEARVGEGTPEGLDAAARLYRGDLLAGLRVDEAPFEDWLLAERERLRELALEALAKLLAHRRGAGALEAAVQTGLRLVAIEPLQEAVHRTLMRLYVELGRRDAALRQYQTCVAALQRGLRVEPEAQTRALYEEILRQRQPRTGPVPAIEASAADARAERPALPAWTELLPRDGALVGRESEMGRLRGALEQADQGQARIGAILGEAGVGKSRLVAELAAEASQRGWRVLVGRAYEAEGGLPLGPWGDALRSGGVAQDAVLGELAPVWRAGLSRLLPALTGTGPSGAPDSDDRLLVFESVAETLTALAVRRPLLLVLEDLHWADGASLRLLGFVGRRLAQARALIVVTARDEEMSDAAVLSEVVGHLDRQGRLDRLPLPPLSREVAMELIRLLAPEIPGKSAEAVAELVWAASQGNPFVLIETLRMIRADAPGTPPSAVAPRVRDVIARRLGRLTDGARELMRTAAVLGREAEFRVLQEASGLEEGQAARAVEELVRSRVLVAQGERFDFVHDRIRQVAYGELLPPRRQLIHRRIAEALERLYHHGREPHTGAFGLHFVGAEVWDKAADYLRLAAPTARPRSGYREAVAYLEQALEAVARLPDGLDTLAQGIDVPLELLWSCLL